MICDLNQQDCVDLFSGVVYIDDVLIGYTK